LIFMMVKPFSALGAAVRRGFARLAPGPKATLLAGALLASAALGAQEPLLLFVDSSTIIARVEAGRVYTGPEEVAFTLVGNTLYDGAEAGRDRMVFLIGAAELFSRRTQEVYFSDGQQVAYTWRRGRLMLGEPGEYPELETLLSVRELEGGPSAEGRHRYGVYDWADDAWLGTVASAREPRPAELLTALHLYVLHYDLDRRVNDRIAAVTGLPSDDSSAAGGRMRLQHGGAYHEWIWDGQTLEPAWGLRPEDEWTFDGRYLTPAMGGTRAQWQWDGTLLKPAWSADAELQWTWQNGTLRPFWGSIPEREWRYLDDRVRPAWNPDPRRTWEVEGNVPLPVIALVVLGLADR
jgi:hypothetical protein